MEEPLLLDTDVVETMGSSSENDFFSFLHPMSDSQLYFHEGLDGVDMQEWRRRYVLRRCRKNIFAIHCY